MGAGFAQLQHRPPEYVRQYHPDEIKIPAQIYGEPGRQVILMLRNNHVRERSRAKKQKKRKGADVLANVHLRKHVLVELHYDKEQQNRQQAVGVIIKVVVLGRCEPELVQTIKLA